MLNQLPITKSFIDHLQNVCDAANTGVSYVQKELKKMDRDSVYDICSEQNENAKQSIAVIADFIQRATHDDYGSKL